MQDIQQELPELLSSALPNLITSSLGVRLGVMETNVFPERISEAGISRKRKNHA
jgi:hypothetical protein